MTFPVGRIQICLSLMAVVCLPVFGEVTPEFSKNYSYLYYEYGFPTLPAGRRPQSEANEVARANPDLVFQTGYYSLMLDCDDIQLEGYDALVGSDYRTALDQDVSIFTPATSFLLRVYQDGTAYDCESGVVQELIDGRGINHVRLIESGQYVKRIDHMGLIFKDSGGNALSFDDECRLEITAWPDRVTFFLDFSSETNNPIEQTTIQVISPDLTAHLSDNLGNQARLTIKPQDDVALSALNANNYITEATRVQDGSALAVSFDADVHAFHIDVPADAVKYPSGNNRVDEYVFEVTNSTASAENIPLVFEQPTVPAITGTAMLLCDADDGRPLGIPVQISKNWHQRWADPDGDGTNEYFAVVHDGPWLRGSTMLTLQPGESRRFKLRVLYGYWGGAGTASHAQLSLIGWGSDWKWDESALGAWGESLTYDPTLHAGAAFLDDIRPAFTTSYSLSPYTDQIFTTNTHNWTENTGGGDFLIYRDSSDTYRWLKRVKTCYAQTGPNLTEVLYSGVTDDDKIRATYKSRMGSTLDYHRHFHDYKYEFLQDVVSPQRLVFHQMAADYYPVAGFTNYYIGDETGVLSTGTIEAGGNVYKGSPISFDNKWLSIDDVTGGNEAALAMRGIIPLSSTLNGGAFPLYIHKYGRTWGFTTMLFDLSSDSVNRSYSAGDVVEGEIEFIMPPQHVTNYWGGDAELTSRLTAYGDTAWEPVRDEFVQNVQMDVAVHQGALMNNYPLEIQADVGNVILADFTINGGGIGHVPVLLKGAESDLELKAQRWTGGVWVDLESVNIAKNTYYQGLQNADGTMDYTFSIPRSALDLNESWRVRMYPKTPVALVSQDSFEVDFDGWINRSDDDINWTRRTGGTPSANTGPIGASDGSYYLYTEATGNFGKVAALSRAFDFSTYSNVEIEFDYHMFGSDMGSLHLDVFDGAVWHYDVWAVAGQQHTASADAWTTATVDLSAYAGATTEVQFRGITGSNFRSDMAVDNIRIVSSAEWLDYEMWASNFGLTSPNAVSSADPDNDMLNNLYEYGLGGDPTNAADIGYVSGFGILEESGTNFFEYVHARRIDAAARGLTYSVETKTNLLSGFWGTNGVVEVGTGSWSNGFETVTNRVAMTNEAEFIRLKIELEP